MTKEEFGDINREVNERIGFRYFQEMTATIAPEWTITHTKNKYERFDITVTNGIRSFIVDTKVRKYYVASIKDEGAFIEVGKVNELIKKGVGALVFFFVRDNKTYVWKLSERNKWRGPEDREMRVNNYSDETTTKPVYYMPLDDEHLAKTQPDISNYFNEYDEMFSQIKEEMGIKD